MLDAHTRTVNPDHHNYQSRLNGFLSSPSGRAHFRTKVEFDREMERIEAELRAEEEAAVSGRLSLDAVFARCGFFPDEAGALVDAETGAKG